MKLPIEQERHLLCSPGSTTRKIALALTFFCSMAGSSLVSPPEAKATSSQPLLQEKKKTVETNLNRLQQGIQSQQEAIGTEERLEADILTLLRALNKKIAQKEARIVSLQRQITEQQKRIAGKEEELHSLNRQNSSLQAHLEKRIRAYYMTGQVGFLNIAFSAKTFSELLAFRDSFDVLIHYDERLFNSYSEVIKKLEASKRALLLEQELLQSFFTEVAQEKEEALISKAEKERLLARSRAQKQLHTEAIKEMLGSRQQLSTHLIKLQDKQARRKNRFLSRKGQLDAPVAGTIVAQFLEKKTNGLGIAETSMGIAIEAQDGSPVIAIEAGKVVSAGYLHGYGNTVIIHHGFQYYTITARLESISTQKGARLHRGDLIGRAGDTATIIDAGLYFEIRHGKKSIDPLSWLKKDGPNGPENPAR